MVPHLTTALTGPLLELERRFLEAETTIERWLRGQWLEYQDNDNVYVYKPTMQDLIKIMEENLKEKYCL